MARKPNKERRARIADKKNDATKGEGLYKVEKGAQKGPDASSRVMPNANGREGEGAQRTGRTRPNSAGRDSGARTRRAVDAKAVKYVMDRRKAKGAAVTRKQAVTIVRKNTTADRNGRAYKYDFAKDGAGVEDKNFGKVKNNKARIQMGKKKNITVKANVKRATSFGTGKIIHRKKETT